MLMSALPQSPYVTSMPSVRTSLDRIFVPVTLASQEMDKTALVSKATISGGGRVINLEGKVKECVSLLCQETQTHYFNRKIKHQN